MKWKYLQDADHTLDIGNSVDEMKEKGYWSLSKG